MPTQNKCVSNLKQLLGLLFTVLLVLSATTGALAADTKLGNYEEAPYKDVVDIYTADFGEDFSPRTYVEIPYEYVFSPEKLRRTVTINGREWEDLVIVSRAADQTERNRGVVYYVFDLFEEQKSRAYDFKSAFFGERNPNYTEEQWKEYVQKAYKWAKESTIEERLGLYFDYPFSKSGMYEAIVSINGQPWQETEFKDQIIAGIRQQLNPSDPLLTNEQYWNILLNPAYNGRGWEVAKKMEEQGITPPGTEQSAAGGNQVILTIGKKEVILYRDGRADIRTLDVAPHAPDGVTMVPLRGVLDFLGAILEYDGTAQTVTVLDGDITVKLGIGKNTALVNEQEQVLLRPPEIKNGRTLIPLRFVGESLGYKVLWDQEKQQITIKK